MTILKSSPGDGEEQEKEQKQNTEGGGGDNGATEGTPGGDDPAVKEAILKKEQAVLARKAAENDSFVADDEPEICKLTEEERRAHDIGTIQGIARRNALPILVVAGILLLLAGVYKFQGQSTDAKTRKVVKQCLNKAGARDEACFPDSEGDKNGFSHTLSFAEAELEEQYGLGDRLVLGVDDLAWMLSPNGEIGEAISDHVTGRVTPHDVLYESCYGDADNGAGDSQ